MDEFELSGIWWLPSNNDRTLGGTLTFSHEHGIRLHLLGSLIVYAQAQRLEQLLVGDGPIHYDIIFGITDSNEVVTLQNCMQSNFHSASNGFDSQDFKIQFAYLGVHADGVDDLRFNRARVQYSYLFDWVGHSSFAFVPASDVTARRQHVLTYMAPEEVQAQIPDGTLTITSSFNYKGSKTNPSMLQMIWAKFEINTLLSLPQWLNHYLSPVQDFLSLATARPNAITKLTFDIPREDIEDQSS